MWRPTSSFIGKSRRRHALFAKLNTEIEEEEAGADQPKLQLPPMYPEPGTKIVDISDEE